MLCTVPCILFALMQERSWLFVQFFTSQFRVYMLATFAGKSGPVSIPGCTVRSGIRMSSRSQSSNILLKINWERCSRSPRSLKGNGWFFGSRLTQTEFLTQIGEIILGHYREEDKYCRISSEQKEKQVRRRYFLCYMEQLISTTYLFIYMCRYKDIVPYDYNRVPVSPAYKIAGDTDPRWIVTPTFNHDAP